MGKLEIKIDASEVAFMRSTEMPLEPGWIRELSDDLNRAVELYELRHENAKLRAMVRENVPTGTPRGEQ